MGKNVDSRKVEKNKVLTQLKINKNEKKVGSQITR